MDDRQDEFSIRPVTSFDVCRNFVAGFQNDEAFSDPMLADAALLRANLLTPIAQPERHAVLGLWRGAQLCGLFSFLVLREERYLEMLAGLSRERAVYQQLLRHLCASFPDYQADFVFNPKNEPLCAVLREAGADFEPVQQKLVLRHAAQKTDTGCIVPLTPRDLAQYLAIHNTDMYWTGARVAAAQEKFRTLLARRGETVVGYLDVTRGHAENEIYDLFVLPAYRRQGFGRALLAQAILENQPNGMVLLADCDNTAALRLFEASGFRAAEHGESVTAHWTLRSPQPCSAVHSRP